jgi:thioredoxin reductase
MDIFDVIIIGGGPAGLNAAVVLGRCQRKVLLFDTGNQRNRFSHGIRNYLTRDCMLPADFINEGHKEIKKYAVLLKRMLITNAIKREDGLFVLKDNNGNTYCAKKILIATGLTDHLPPIKGFREFYGRSIFHCPYCDAWEVRNKKIAVYAKNKNGSELALSLHTWSRWITYFTDGKKYLKPREQEMLRLYNIPIITDPIEKLEGSNGQLQKILLKNGEQHSCDALFFVNGYSPQSNLVEQLGCTTTTKKKMVITNKYQQTTVPGVFVAGDADKDMHFVVIAAAEGAKAAVVINKELQKEERAKKIKPSMVNML